MVLPKVQIVYKKRFFKHILLVIWEKKILLVVIILVTILTKAFFQSSLHKQIYQHDPQTFFSVFLSNDQVYFGHIFEDTQDTLVLHDVYYLKTDNSTTTSAKLSLVKLGKELHNPKDKIFINRDHVIYYEEMGNESQIVKNILSNEVSKP